jgi:hypothetical protein
MQRRWLGGLGWATMTPFYDEPDEEAAIDTLRRSHNSDAARAALQPGGLRSGCWGAPVGVDAIRLKVCLDTGAVTATGWSRHRKASRGNSPHMLCRRWRPERWAFRVPGTNTSGRAG